MLTRTIDKLFAIAVFSIFSMQVQADATAMARVSANIVPAVSASVSGSMIMRSVNNVKSGSVPGVTNTGVVSLETPEAGKQAQFKIRNFGNLDYVVTVSPVINTTAKRALLNNYTLPQPIVTNGAKTSQKLTMKASMQTSGKNNNGAYNGSIYITANFN